MTGVVSGEVELNLPGPGGTHELSEPPGEPSRAPEARAPARFDGRKATAASGLCSGVRPSPRGVPSRG